jgi:HlyD family secretion protein
VVRMATKGVNTSNVVTFEVKIEVLSEEKRLLRPEMTANVDIIAASRDGVLMVPSEAIFRKAGRTHVTAVPAGGAQEDRLVETGISDGQKTEIASGLSEGETVIVSNGADSKFKADQNRPRGPLGLH